jgi:hypothetical protein
MPNLNDDLPYSIMGAGQRSMYGTFIPPGGRVAAYVRSTGSQTGDDLNLLNMLVPTLNAGLARCRSGMGDSVIVLPGHVESITGADFMSSLVAGTNIIGVGTGTTRPTFTWTATASTFLFDVADTVLVNCILKIATSANAGISVAAPITVSAAGCAILGCQILAPGDANDLATIGVTTTAAATDFTFAHNEVWMATAAACTTFLRIVGSDRCKIIGNRITGATSSVVVGLIQFITTDSLDCVMEDNYIRNNVAASSAAVSVSAGATSSSGYVNNLYMCVLDDAANNLVLGDAVGAWGLSVASFSFGRHVYVANLAGERMAEVTAVSA